MNPLIADIYEHVLPMMAKANIEDTTPNRIAYLSGIRDAWKESPTYNNTQKSLYLIAISLEILKLKLTEIHTKN